MGLIWEWQVEYDHCFILLDEVNLSTEDYPILRMASFGQPSR